jgi:hypothetical protein
MYPMVTKFSVMLALFACSMARADIRECDPMGLSASTSECDPNTNPSTLIPRIDACEAQAHKWCEAIGFGTSSGCVANYHHNCDGAGFVFWIDQAACLVELDHVVPGLGGEPALCIQTWDHPPPIVIQ